MPNLRLGTAQRVRAETGLDGAFGKPNIKSESTESFQISTERRKAALHSFLTKAKLLAHSRYGPLSHKCNQVDVRLTSYESDVHEKTRRRTNSSCGTLIGYSQYDAYYDVSRSEDRLLMEPRVMYEHTERQMRAAVHSDSMDAEDKDFLKPIGGNTAALQPAASLPVAMENLAIREGNTDSSNLPYKCAVTNKTAYRQNTNLHLGLPPRRVVV